MQRPWRRALAVRLSIHLAFGAALPAQACWDDAAQRYQVSSALLYAIARTESGLNPQAIGRNGNGSRDIGVMQINSPWLPTLASHGIGSITVMSNDPTDYPEGSYGNMRRVATENGFPSP